MPNGFEDCVKVETTVAIVAADFVISLVGVTTPVGYRSFADAVADYGASKFFIKVETADKTKWMVTDAYYSEDYYGSGLHALAIGTCTSNSEGTTDLLDFAAGAKTIMCVISSASLVPARTISPMVNGAIPTFYNGLYPSYIKQGGILGAEDIFIEAALSLKTRVVTAAGGITVAGDDSIIVVKKTVAATTAVTIQSTVSTPGRIVTIIDGSGNANTYNITVSNNNSKTINGAATFVMNVAYQSVSFLWTGTEFLVLSRSL